MSSVINHLPGTFYVELRQDYIILCSSLTYKKSEKSKSSSHCKALILAVMEHWTNDKIKKKIDLYVYMTYSQWVDAIYGIFGRFVILDSLDELVGEKLIIRERHQVNSRESYRYLLHVNELNRRLADLPRLQIDATRPKVDATSLFLDGTDLQVDGNLRTDASKSRRFIEGTEIQHSDTEKECMPPDQQKWFAEIYCKSKIVTIPPPVTETLKKHIATLSKHIKTVEQLNSLYDYSKPKIRGKNPTVYAGNLVHFLNGWLQAQPSQEAPTQPDEEKTVIWSKTPCQKYSEALERWYLYERMTISEARQYGYDGDYVPLTPMISNQIENKLKKLAKDELPP